MATLITRLRTVAGIPGVDAIFTDEELQAFLDERRANVAAGLLVADTVLSGSPTVFRAPVRWWEADAALVDVGGATLTPVVGAGTDPLAGVWTFASGQSWDVYVTGRNYDLYGSAAAVLQARAALVATEFNFATDQQTFDRSQKREGLLAVAREHARKAISPGMRSAW